MNLKNTLGYTNEFEKIGIGNTQGIKDLEKIKVGIKGIN